MMTHQDLRSWLDRVEGFGELRRGEGAHWNLEIGAITELCQLRRNGPAILFDKIPDHPPGHRVLVNALGSWKRLALTLGLSTEMTAIELVRAWRDKQSIIRPISSKYVSDGPILENVQTGSDIDLTQFPVPQWHELDGGRYIGTGSVDVTMDPEEGWVNVGTYRVMLLDRKHVSFYISPGRHGRLHRDKFFASKDPMPVVMSFGHHPLVLLTGVLEVAYGTCEFDYAGGILGEPVEVIKGEHSGLPFPAHAEIVIEGIARCEQLAPEGPFGEWSGYYASAPREEPVVEVTALYYRNNPILLGAPPGRPPAGNSFFQCFMRAAVLEEELRNAGVPDITGVWCHEVGGSRLFNVVSIKQRYPGHAKQAGTVATFCHTGAYLGRYTIVVDDDIDVMSLDDVMWAVSTRSDPARSIEIIKKCWSGPLDPAIERDSKNLNSRAIIDACRPFEWLKDFPPVVGCSPQLREKTIKKWGDTVLR